MKYRIVITFHDGSTNSYTLTCDSREDAEWFGAFVLGAHERLNITFEEAIEDAITKGDDE